MDTSKQRAVIPRDKEVSVASLRQRGIAEIVEETLGPTFLAGRLGEPEPGIKLLPVRVSESKSAPVVVEHRVADVCQPQPGTIHIEFRQAQVRIEGSADPALVRVLLECLRA